MSSVNPRRRSEDAGLALKTSSPLLKGATFHAPSSTAAAASSPDSTFSPPNLSRSHTALDDVVDANRRRIAMTLNEVEEALAQTQFLSLSDKPAATSPQLLGNNTHPLPRGFLDLHAEGSAMALDTAPRRLLRPRSARRPQSHTHTHASDSGLGSSLSSNEKSPPNKGGITGTSGGKQIQAITRSAATASAAQNLPALGRKAIGRIHAHTLRPLLEKPSLKEFQPIVLDVPRKIRSKEIICLRDLEKTLIFMAPVSQLKKNDTLWAEAYRTLCQKEKAKTAALYLDFCLTSIRCLQATVEYLSDREQTQPGDRPYTNGYFIDLKEQIYQYGRQLASLKEDGITAAANLDFDQSDEIKLYGGIAENGRPAELIRIRKDGTAVSMATGKVVDLAEAPVHIKRSLSEQREDEEEIMRSMARRKKNATPEELAPKRCREPGCTKEFKRPCDLTKHEKTHSRPWKCPFATCKYHDFGWPTEKEMDRHVNDKHSDAPATYECFFKPCPYKSKRESNCKQHMEKAHGWQYVRTKTNGKKSSVSVGKPASVQQQTPPLGNVSTPSTDPSYGISTPPHDQPLSGVDFPLYPNNQDWLNTHDVPTDMDLLLENPSPASATSYEQYPPYQNGSAFIINEEDLYAAHMQLPAHITEALAAQIFQQQQQQQQVKMMPQQLAQSFQMAPQLPLAQPQQQQQQMSQVQNQSMQFSPQAQQNAMLYTPDSQQMDSPELDEGDFQLFPTMVSKSQSQNQSQTLFGEVPSAHLGFSQNSQQDIFNQIGFEWSNFDYAGFPE